MLSFMVFYTIKYIHEPNESNDMTWLICKQRSLDSNGGTLNGAEARARASSHSACLNKVGLHPFSNAYAKMFFILRRMYRVTKLTTVLVSFYFCNNVTSNIL